MGRRQYRQDLAALIDNPPPHISTIRSTDDAEISFSYIYYEIGVQCSASLQLLALNVDDYPVDNQYMLFARDDSDISPRIANAFEVLCPLIRDKSIKEALTEISTGLYQAITVGESSNPIDLAGSSDVEDHDDAPNFDSDEDVQEEEDDWFNDDNDEAFGLEAPKKLSPVTIGRTNFSQLDSEDRKKIKADLRDTKDAGFKLGVIGDLCTSGILCVSIRVNKLGISEEVMKAWSLEPQQYFVVLIRYQNGYRSLDSLKEEPSLSGSTEVRVGLCSSYKPNNQSAFDAFNEGLANQTQHSQSKVSGPPKNLDALFIGGPLNELFRSRFSRIVKFRLVYALHWAGAEQLVHDVQGAAPDSSLMHKYHNIKDNNTHRALPPIVMSDAMEGHTTNLELCSMPLVTMQFALRHFVRCTDFCLVCHCNAGSTFEALKPYVCSNPLCLYQYMALGFGPSIEWEVLSQPYVVDLLISFCYVQALAGQLKDFPVGIDLRVPVLPQPLQQNLYPPCGARAQTSNAQGLVPEASFQVSYNGKTRELLFEASKMPNDNNIKKGNFITLVSPGNFDGFMYHRIDEVLLPAVRLGPPVHVSKAKDHNAFSDRSFQVDCYLFSNNFDDLSNEDKCKAIISLLDTIPPVKEMVGFLKTHSIGQDSSLRQWRDRISPAALNILRWIIASNRSCIMQVDNLVEGALTDVPIEDRVSGMDDYMQFRFAQGAPDKEQRFIDCVRTHTSGSQYPTIFAWHGSPLQNWHSIIREGLHYKDTVHGRAFGHGVYLSTHAITSVGYSNMYCSAGVKSGWSNSELNVSNTLSLNEVVNRVDAFVSKTPHYVVDNIDWIQTRYLLVKVGATKAKVDQAGMDTILQDPAYTVMGLQGTTVQIPITAIAKSRRSGQQTKKGSRKRKSFGTGRFDEPIEIEDDDNDSVATLNEDREYLLDDEPPSGQTPSILDSDTDMELGFISSPKKKKMRQNGGATSSDEIEGWLLDRTKTDFVPGSLDMSNIKILPPPDDASIQASSSLLKAFNTLLRTQRTTAIHELGWYINPSQVENMYQWIIELHSFDRELPLAKDMKSVGIGSIVLEMRFTNDYPFAPPFVRVVKPRFLPFQQGGGGHVTDGGAICMELLTNDGWSAASSIESVLLQVRLAMSETERPAKLASRSNNRAGSVHDGVYQVGEAIAAYERACRAHGWKVPPAFAAFLRGDDSIGRRV